jgi:hypothetical protein
LGKTSLPAALSVKFINDTVKRMTADQVSPILCEVGMEVPVTQVAFPTIAAAALSTLPAKWVLDTSDKLLTALRMLMPVGDFRQAEITANSTRMPGQPGYNQKIRIWGRRGSPQVVYDQLKRVLRLDNVSTWLDPCASTCKLAKILVSPKYTVFTNECYNGAFDGVTQDSQFKLDPTQPSTFQKWQRDGHCTGGFISIPWPKLLDLVLPLAALTTAKVTCFYVPYTYVTSPPAARLEWMKTLQQVNRLLIIMGIPRDASIAESSGVWMCIFRDSEVRSALVDKKYYRADDCCVFAE